MDETHTELDDLPLSTVTEPVRAVVRRKSRARDALVPWLVAGGILLILVPVMALIAIRNRAGTRSDKREEVAASRATPEVNRLLAEVRELQEKSRGQLKCGI